MCTYEMEKKARFYRRKKMNVTTRLVFECEIQNETHRKGCPIIHVCGFTNMFQNGARIVSLNLWCCIIMRHVFLKENMGGYQLISWK